MSRRPAIITQADVARAIRAADQAGSGRVVEALAPPEQSPSPPQAGERATEPDRVLGAGNATATPAAPYTGAPSEIAAAIRDASESDLSASRAEVERLRAALEPFAAVAEHDIGTDETDADLFRPMTQHNAAPRLVIGDFRRARAALRKMGAGR